MSCIVRLALSGLWEKCSSIKRCCCSMKMFSSLAQDVSLTHDAFLLKSKMLSYLTCDMTRALIKDSSSLVKADSSIIAESLSWVSWPEEERMMFSIRMSSYFLTINEGLLLSSKSILPMPLILSFYRFLLWLARNCRLLSQSCSLMPLCQWLRISSLSPSSANERVYR